MKKSALVLANHSLKSPQGKTAHGLIRKCERYNIVGVIDPDSSGEDLSNFFPHARSIPVFATVSEAIQLLKFKPDLCITGIATHGGIIPETLKTVFVEAICHGLSVVNSLHEHLSDNPEFTALAQKHGVTLTDIRKSKRTRELRFWNGEIFSVKCPIIAILGTDCALGKRTTTQMILDSCRAEGLNAHMIYTGQTGWLQGGQYGFIFDVTPNDFVSGEIEGAILSCYRAEKPDIILIEGQSSLRNPSGPCGAEFLLSGNAKSVILQHSPRRIYYDGYENLGLKLPPIQDEIALIRHYGAKVMAVAMNSEEMSRDEIVGEKILLQEFAKVPVVSVLEDGADQFLPIIRDLMRNAR